MAAIVPPDRAARSWREAIAVYAHPRVVAMAFLGFSAGLPFLLVFSTLSAWLREEEIARSAIGFFSWVGITYSIKVFWAPVVDRLPLPWLTRRLGRRRGWILLAQIGIALGLAAIAVSDPARHIPLVAAFAVLVAFSSATQDIAIDAYRIEAVAKELQGAMAATYVLGYRVALLMAGAGAFFIADHLSWPVAYLAMAGLMLIGMATVLLVREPETRRDSGSIQREEDVVRAMAKYAHLSDRGRSVMVWFSGAVVGPFVDFFARNGVMAVVILLFISVYKLSDITMGVMANPFYIDLGFTLSEIASITKFFGFFMTIAGAALGGILVVRFGIMRTLLLGAVLVATTNLLFAQLALMGRDLLMLTVTISADNLGGGLATAAFIAYLSSLTNTAYTATQYALFSSLMTLPGKFIGGFSGVVVDTAGYVPFFLLSSSLGLPAILLVIFLMRRMNADAVATARAGRGVD